jgi:hypothetical protein
VKLQHKVDSPDVEELLVIIYKIIIACISNHYKYHCNIFIIIIIFRSITLFHETDNIMKNIPHSYQHMRIFYGILLIPHTIIMDLNNVMIVVITMNTFILEVLLLYLRSLQFLTPPLIQLPSLVFACNED